MTQPDYVPLVGPDRIRPSARLTLPGSWTQDRPGELTDLEQPTGPSYGSSGPDLGYGMKLAKRFSDRLVLRDGEDEHDVVAGCFACGIRRAASFGRAPVIHDMEWAYGLWGYLAPAPDELAEMRAPLFRGAAHDYAHERRVVDAVAEEALRLTPAQVKERVGGGGGGWRSFFVS